MFNFNLSDRYVCVPLHAFSELTGNELKLLGIMINQWSSMADKTGWYFRSVRDLCKDTGMSDKTVQKCLKTLLEKKYLSVKDNNKMEYANYYQLNERLWQPVSKPYPELGLIGSVVTESTHELFSPAKYEILN